MAYRERGFTMKFDWRLTISRLIIVGISCYLISKAPTHNSIAKTAYPRGMRWNLPVGIEARMTKREAVLRACMLSWELTANWITGINTFSVKGERLKKKRINYIVKKVLMSDQFCTYTISTNISF